MSTLKALTPGDAFFLLIESDKTPSQIGMLARMKLPEGADKNYLRDLVENFRQYQPKSAPFNLKLAKRKLTRPGFHWEQVDNIDIDYHLRHSALPKPGGERELAVLISRLHSIPLDKNRPMWECHIIEGLEDNCFALYSKMHHALLDGVAGARLMSQWMSQTSPDIDENFVPYWAMPANSKKKRTTQATTEIVGADAASLLAQVTKPVKMTSGVFAATLKSVLGSVTRQHPNLIRPYSAPNCILNDAVGPQRRVSTVELKTDRLLSIGKALGGTLNDVVMAVCGGALRSYLQELDALPDRDLVSQVPVSFRSKEDASGGNAIGMVLSSLGTTEADTLHRFKKVAGSMSAAKALLSNMNAAQITAYSALMTLPFTLGQMTGLGNRRNKPMYNVVISNVPGPRDKRYLNGAEVFSVHPISFVMQGQALNITLFTYGDDITFVFTACRETLPSVQRLVQHTTNALEELEKIANKDVTPAPNPKRRARKKATTPA